MRFVQLHTLSMAARNLTEAELTGACLYACDLRNTNFERASLYCGDLRLADASGANFTRADLRGVTLRGAVMNRAVLDGADMRSALIAVADEAKGLTTLRYSRDNKTSAGPAIGDDGEAVQFSVDFTDASLVGARLDGASLKHAKFDGAILTGVSLKGARLEGVSLKGAVLTGVDISRLGLSSSQLEGCLLDPSPEARERASFIAIRLEDAENWWRSGGKQGHPAMLDGEDLRVLNGAFAGRSLTALSAKNAICAGVNFSNAHLQSTSFDGADLRGANFEGADLRGSSFRGARLGHARFSGATVGALRINASIQRPTRFDGAENLNLTGSVSDPLVGH
jgi:uncharacterized protein YjbI with pentapeptide repeats